MPFQRRPGRRLAWELFLRFPVSRDKRLIQTGLFPCHCRPRIRTRRRNLCRIPTRTIAESRGPPAPITRVDSRELQRLPSQTGMARQIHFPRCRHPRSRRMLRLSRRHPARRLRPMWLPKSLTCRPITSTIRNKASLLLLSPARSRCKRQNGIVFASVKEKQTSCRYPLEAGQIRR
jgi:hypothetical protein